MSDYFMAPSVTLETAGELLEALETPAIVESWESKPYPFSWRVRSEWLVNLIREIEESGQYPYNATVAQLAISRLGLPEMSYAELSKEGTTLSRLVYNAQGFRRSDDLVNAGYSQLDQAMVESAGDGGRIEIAGENLLGGPCSNVFNVRRVNGELYLMKPNARKYRLMITGQPAKIVKRKAMAKVG
jgi:hypothetical protein